MARCLALVRVVRRGAPQLWDFANGLAASRSSSLEGYLCGSSKSARSQVLVGAGSLGSYGTSAGEDGGWGKSVKNGCRWLAES